VTNTGDKSVSLRVFMTEETRTKFKSECVLTGVSMSEQVVRLIDDWLKDREQAKAK
jgi:hypothetical protein